MFEFLKKLFKEEEAVEEIEFPELGKWLVAKMDLGLITDFAELKKILADMEKDIQVLESVSVSEAKVEQKLKELVIGNKRAYAISLRSFINSILTPEKLDHKSIMGFCTGLESALAEFSQKTIRNYYIMKNLIGKELEAIALDLKKLEVLTRGMKKKISEKNLELLEQVHHKLSEIYKYLGETEKRNKELSELEQGRAGLLEKEAKLKKEIDGLKEGPLFAAFTEAKGRKESLEQRELNLKNELIGLFAILSRPLRKLAKLKPDKLIEKYIEDPHAALLHDIELKIDDILAELQKHVKAKKIEEKGEEKLINIVKGADREYFSRVKLELKNISSELKKCEEAIAENKFEEERDRLLKRLNSVEREMGEADARIDAIKSQKVDEDIKTIDDDIKKLGFGVKIKNAPYH